MAKTNPFQFIQQVRSEVSKVVWPTRREVLLTTGMVVAMAAWCAPCREELPTLGNLYRKYKDKGLNMVGLSLDVGGPGVIQPIVDRMEVPFPVFWGGDKMAFRYRISAIPLIMIVHKGEVMEKIIGQRSESFLEEKVTAMLTKCNAL